jgi:hypothetical protein
MFENFIITLSRFVLSKVIDQTDTWIFLESITVSALVMVNLQVQDRVYTFCLHLGDKLVTTHNYIIKRMVSYILQSTNPIRYIVKIRVQSYFICCVCHVPPIRITTCAFFVSLSKIGV